MREQIKKKLNAINKYYGNSVSDGESLTTNKSVALKKIKRVKIKFVY